MRCRLALPAVLTLLALPVGAGCRLGGGSGMTSCIRVEASAASESEELAAAPPFEGEIVKPSTKATPYPTTSTPQGYVVPGSTETPEATQVVAAPPEVSSADPATGRTPPVTYGMKPADVAAIAGTESVAGPTAFAAAEPPTTDGVAAQQGPYAPITPVGQADAPPQTVAAGFSAAGGGSAGLYPPEQEAGLPPPAGRAASYPQPGAAASGFAGSMPPAGESAPPASTFTATPPAAGSSFASQPPVAEIAPDTGSSFAASQGSAVPAATVSAFGQPAAVPEGAASDSPVAGSRYASAGASRFGGGAVAEPSAFSAVSQSQAAGGGSPWQPTPSDASVEPPPPASAYASAENSFSAPPAERSFDAANAAPTTGFGDQPAGFDHQASQPASPESGRTKRRPDPMYRPAGTSSYRPSEPIFSDEPASRGPVQMATFEETVALPPQQ